MSTPPPARPEAMRRHNMSLVLREIHRDGALTRAELTHRLGLSRSTIGALVSDLSELDVLRESVPNGGTRAGRPSHVVGPHEAGPYVIAVDVDVTQVSMAAVGLGGVVLARQVVPTGRRRTTPQATAELVMTTLPTLRKAADLTGLPVGIGVSVPGTVDTRCGHVGVAPNLGWRNENFGDVLRSMAPVGVPVAVGNDANLAALAEHQRGTARNCSDIVYLIGRIGVGAGIIMGDRPLFGHDGHAGEIGHNVVDTAGPECHCGKRGCTETYIGAEALLKLAGRPLPPTDEAVREVLSDARAGGGAALAAVRTVAESVGRSIAFLLNTLNPQYVVLGGSLADVLSIARPEIEASLARFALEAPTRTVQLCPPSLGSDSALIGAAEIAFATLLEDPLAVTAP